MYAPLTSVQEKYYTSIINKTIYQVVQEEKMVSRGTSPEGDNVLQESNGTIRQSSRVSKQR